ncbi:MAG: hypothetical protein R3F55_16185 [Alphaproteobacteria bacterium]
MRNAGIAAGLIVGLGAGAAQAMMPPEVYEQARASAPLHLVVEIVAVEPADAAIGTCSIDAVVVETLRDATGSVDAGDPVSFAVDCLRADADPNMIPDCVIFQNVEALLAGVQMDVYLDTDLFGYSLVLGQARIVAPGGTGA